MIQEPSKSLSQEISYKHLCKDLSQDVVRIFTTSSRKDVHKTLVKIFTDHGPLRQTGTTVFCEPAQSKCTWTYQKGPFQQKKNSMEMPQTMTAPPILCEPARSKCTRRSHKELLCENLQWKARGHKVYLDLTPAFNTEHQNPSVWTLFGESYRVGYIFYIKYIVQPSNPPPSWSWSCMYAVCWNRI